MFIYQIFFLNNEAFPIKPATLTHPHPPNLPSMVAFVLFPPPPASANQIGEAAEDYENSRQKNKEKKKEDGFLRD